MHAHRPSLPIAAALLATLLAACGGGSDGGGSSKVAIEAYVAAVKSFDGTITATVHTGTPPAATGDAGGGPEAVVVGAVSGTYLRGGTSVLTVTGTATRVIVAVDGIDGYWELTGLTSGTQSIQVTFGQSSPLSFTLRLGAGTASGISSYQTLPVTLTTVGTGQVQVNVTWDLDVDVDLHVLDPQGNEIYYSNTSANGGQLDLDSNAGCSLDHVRAENITWASNAPKGTYKVLVDYYSACTSGTVNYVVTVNVNGQSPQTYTRSFASNADDGGSACFPSSGTTLLCGVQVATFTVN